MSGHIYPAIGGPATADDGPTVVVVVMSAAIIPQLPHGTLVPPPTV
ncbi:protein of unknown function [Candidatus Nitrospira inopinata]|uniref:Uncharacterized protein n=1 Tax=Candidatus Nitrospira inopinata TaxID=1715989 RepID=A0A0S4KW56_9BACT|nr:protein of unknown function [Candidatus Nitrospira inopinata]